MGRQESHHSSIYTFLTELSHSLHCPRSVQEYLEASNYHSPILTPQNRQGICSSEGSQYLILNPGTSSQLHSPMSVGKELVASMVGPGGQAVSSTGRFILNGALGYLKI